MNETTTAPGQSADALLAGASGLVGRELARAWVGAGQLHQLLRAGARPERDDQPVLRVDYAALPPLPPARDAYCCLGSTLAVAGSQAAFRAVDHDAVLAFARAARAAGASGFALVSALGADARSRNFYSRVKGEAEDALAALGFERLLIARPSLLAGERAALGQPARTGERLALAITRPLAPLIPAAWRPIGAARVAQAMRRTLPAMAPGQRVLSSAEMQAMDAGPPAGPAAGPPRS